MLTNIILLKIKSVIVMFGRLLSGSDFLMSEPNLWVVSCRDHDECVSVLAGLRLWHSQHLQGGLQGYILNPVFKDNLKIALLGG